MELTAYDCISMDYFYLGELTKAQYYHERAVGGKMENNQSIVKKVTINFLKSRREQKQNDSMRDYSYEDAQKKKSEMQRLPSPSSLNKGASKGISLLPYCTEAQFLGIKEEDEENDPQSSNKKPRQAKSAQNGSRNGKANFTMKELQHMNRAPPKQSYLK
jgi:hypothetical protein